MSTLIPTPPLGGWTRTQLIELADRRTERRGSKTLDLNSEFIGALQTLCMETRWSWRRRATLFRLRAGVWQYDMTTSVAVPAPDAYTNQPTWPFASAQRAGGFVNLLFPQGSNLPTLVPGEEVFLLSARSPSLNGPVEIVTPGSDNLLVNPGFEQGLNGWIGNGMAIASNPVHTGTHSLQLSWPTELEVQQEANVPLTPVAMTVSGWVYIAAYAGNRTIEVGLSTFNATGAHVGFYTANAVTTTLGSWQHVTLTFTPTSAEVTGFVFVGINGAGSTPGQVEAYFDDISLVVGAGPNLLVNAGFENGLTGWRNDAIAIVSAPVRSGNQAVQISGGPYYPGEAVFQQASWNLTPGVPIQLTAWIYLVQYAGTMSVSFTVATRNALQAPVASYNANANTTLIGVWQQVQVTFTPQPNEVFGQASCIVNGGTGTAGVVVAIFDDLVVHTAIVGRQEGGNVSMVGGATDVMGLRPFTFVEPINAIDFHQFVKHGFKIYPTEGRTDNWGEITPMFERELQTAAIYTNLNNPIRATPLQYFMMPGAFLVLCIIPVPDRDYPVLIDYWLCPNVALDSMPEQIPIVPAYMHHVLLKGLEAQIFRYTLGEGAAKYQATVAEYNMLVTRYQGMDGMVPGEQNDYSEDDDYETPFRNAHNAVQSTN